VLDVEVVRRSQPTARHPVPGQQHGHRVDDQAGDPALLLRLAQRRPVQGPVVVAVPTGLQPAPEPGVQGEQNPPVIVAHDESTRGEVFRSTGASHGVGMAQQVLQVRAAQLLL